MSDRAEANIESSLRELWGKNGPDFVIQRLKVLKADTEKTLVDPDYRYSHQDGEQSVAWDHKNCRPKGALGVIYRKFPNPVKRIRVIGAVISSITYERETPQQVLKMVNAVRGNTRSNQTIKLSDRQLYRLERSLERRVRQVSKPFGYTDLTNNVLPYGCVSHETASNKAKLSAALENEEKHPELRSAPETRKAIMELHADKLGQFYTAPTICKSSWNNILKTAYAGEPIPNGVAYPSKVQPRPLVARDYMTTSKEYGVLCDDSGEYSPRGAADYLGRFDFLQKPGGKLRSVANVNRYVNYTTEPYAKALEDFFYGLPCCAVRNQKNGLRWAQEQLAAGKTLSSLDLSSATDTLDFRVFTRGLKRDFPGKTGLLEQYATYFEKLSQLPLWCEPLGSAIQFKTGQPLGMKGSFQTLTAMNLLAGFIAERDTYGDARENEYTPGDHFRVVGDDFVCESTMAPAYNSVIQSWGGKTNVEKCMESDKYAEFLSHIVTKDRVYVTKPKYRLGTKALYTNLEKAPKRECLGIYRLSQTEKNAIDILSQYSVDEMDYRNSLPHLRSKDLSLSDYELEVMDAALQLVSEFRGGAHKDFTLSEVALDYVFEEDYSRGSSEVYDYTESPVIRENGTVRLPKGPLIHEGIATLPTRTEVYDHHIGGKRLKTSRKEQKALMEDKARTMEKIHKSLTTSEDGVIDLGHGLTASSESVALSAMQRVEHKEVIPNRLEATRQKLSNSEQTSSEASLRIAQLLAKFETEFPEESPEDEYDGPDL
jgi:hypothetical protein